MYECNECWYFSTNKRDVHAHKQLHVKRGALYNCAQCVFNVTKSAVLYHHYRYGHVVEEPELRYPEDSVVRAGHRDMMTKNADERLDDKTEVNVVTITGADESLGPPMVWTYNKDHLPPFAKVFKCRYCPHTNRRRHNTVEHERMHSDHPEHQHHRQQQQRAANSSVLNTPLHPCKRCTYVCNNAGVLASHFKVHSASYGYATVGFYDGTIVDAMQVRALEYVMELERSLLLDNDYGYSGRRSADGREPSADSSADSDGQHDESKYIELDDPELKFCPYCPARFFFRFDLRCHIRFHKLRGWSNSCDCCSYTARANSHVSAHEIVHRDEYAQRTAELLASGYPVSRHYPRPSEYPESVGDSLTPPQRRSCSPSRSPKYKQANSLNLDGSRNRRVKRSRNSNSTDHPITSTPPVEPLDQEYDEKTKRRRRSSTMAVVVETGRVKPPSPLPLPPPSLPVKTGVAIKTTHVSPIKTPTAPIAVAIKSTSGAIIKSIKTSKSNYVRQFKCDMCPGRFFKATALQYHRTLHGGSGLHKCRRCDYTVSTYGNLVRHESVHRDLPPRPKVKPGSPTKASGKSPPKPKDIVTKSVEDDSVKVTETPPAPEPEQIQLPTDDTNDEEFPIDPEFGPSMLGNPDFFYPTTVKNGVSRPKRYKCAKCPSAFDKRDQYALHLTLHGARDKYQCDKCDYSVRYTANYVQHQRKHAHDAEIRKNNEQAAGRAKMIEEQEAASRAPRVRKRPNSAVQRKPQTDEAADVALEPRETVFRNEISDRQTAYELNAAYGPTDIVDRTGLSAALFRCTNCPFDCRTRAELDRHCLHHLDQPPAGLNLTGAGALPVAPKRTWRRSCRFCSYRTHAIVDLEEHTRVHFLRSTGVVLSSMAASALNGGDKDESISITDHVEFHGKRVIYQQRNRRETSDRNGDENDDNDVAVEKDVTAVDGGVADGVTNPENEKGLANDVQQPKEKKEEEEEPFFVFKDLGVTVVDNGRTKRFIPESQPPLFDVNDNRTGGVAVDDKFQNKQVQQQTTFVRFVEGGKQLEFLEDGPGGDTVDAAGKKKKVKKQ